jgi:hypothetical protein
MRIFERGDFLARRFHLHTVPREGVKWFQNVVLDLVVNRPARRSVGEGGKFIGEKGWSCVLSL